jgi:hypothetical protein
MTAAVVLRQHSYGACPRTCICATTSLALHALTMADVRVRVCLLLLAAGMLLCRQRGSGQGLAGP